MSTKIVIIGAGESGMGATQLAHVKGYDVMVSSQDSIASYHKKYLEAHNIPYEEGRHTLGVILQASFIVKSPGVDINIAPLQSALQKGIPIIDEIEFAYNHCKGKIIAITGSNGKTTTALLIYHLLQHTGKRVTIAGNIGESFSRKVAESSYDWYIVEVSSFQLENIDKFRPHIAVLLNITPDHLDRYENSFQHYVDAKFRLLNNLTATDHFIYNADDFVIRHQLKKRDTMANKLSFSLNTSSTTYVYEHEKRINFYIGKDKFSIDANGTFAVGAHHMMQIMAATMAAHIAGALPESMGKALKMFSPPAHRLELIAIIDGVRYVNDAKATNVAAVCAAMESYDGPIIWIAGGIDKGNDYVQIREQVYKKVKAMYCLGADNRKLLSFFKSLVSHIDEFVDMKTVVHQACFTAQSGDVVLLSPACASFDLFKNYEQKGNAFKEAVLQLTHTQKKTLYYESI